jgi:hypothetical protein
VAVFKFNLNMLRNLYDVQSMKIDRKLTESYESELGNLPLLV